MIGAIIGDIVGSRFEFANNRSKRFDLFHKDCAFTDDTICTVAVADWLLKNSPGIKTKSHEYLADSMESCLKNWCTRYPTPKGGYGGMFLLWLQGERQYGHGGYNSYGNGSAMRVSPVGWVKDFYNSEVLMYANVTACVTHNNPEGIKGAQAISDAIFMLRAGISIPAVVELISNLYDYDNPGSCSYLSKHSTFDETCQVCIPITLQCLLESHSFEDAIRNAVYVGGDTDTIAAIVGSMAEAAFGIPSEIREQALSFLPDDMLHIIEQFETRLKA